MHAGHFFDLLETSSPQWGHSTLAAFAGVFLAFPAFFVTSGISLPHRVHDFSPSVSVCPHEGQSLVGSTGVVMLSKILDEGSSYNQ
jgi:hypothetical protein